MKMVKKKIPLQNKHLRHDMIKRAPSVNEQVISK